MILISSLSDIGIKKSVNQDAILVKRADSAGAEIVFAAVCDGMGGLVNGELASSHLVSELDNWFEKELPQIIRSGISNNKLKESLTTVILEANDVIQAFGEREGACGTTVSGILLFMGHYAVVNVGDSRVYSISQKDGLYQITHDHSLVQRLIDKGRITEEQSKTHPQRNVLLQCVGAGGKVAPEYDFGYYNEGDVFLVCSDGFRHKLSEEEIELMFNPKDQINEQIMRDNIEKAIDINKERKEKDNISVIALKVKEG